MRPNAALESTQLSWDAATRIHNAHKGDQVAFFKNGGEVLFAEELELLGDVRRKRLVHLQCNSGQDSICLARRGAQVLGVDFSAEAIGFARTLSSLTELPCEWEQRELLEWLANTPRRFELAFSSYGTVGWMPDLDAWARGIARILEPDGRFVLVEFHPVLWSVGPTLRIDKDDYFYKGAFHEPVGDYVAESGNALNASDGSTPQVNTIPAMSYQYGLAQTVDALLRAGLSLETLREYPFSNGCRVHPSLVSAADRRFVWPEGAARIPLMYGLSARRPVGAR